MSDKELSKRLRNTMPEYLKGILSSDDVEGDLNEAADKIARLRAALDEALPILLTVSAIPSLGRVADDARRFYEKHKGGGDEQR